MRQFLADPGQLRLAIAVALAASVLAQVAAIGLIARRARSEVPRFHQGPLWGILAAAALAVWAYQAPLFAFSILVASLFTAALRARRFFQAGADQAAMAALFDEAARRTPFGAAIASAVIEGASFAAVGGLLLLLEPSRQGWAHWVGLGVTGGGAVVALERIQTFRALYARAMAPKTAAPPEHGAPAA